MDGIYLPNGRQLALIDRDWILDELPHLGNPDDNSDANYLLASVAVANSGTAITAGSRNTSGIGPGSGASHGAATHTGTGIDGTGTGTGTGANTGTNHHDIGTSHNHSLLYNPEEFEGDLTLLSEIVDETQNKWSDFGLHQLLTSYARSIRSTFK